MIVAGIDEAGYGPLLGPLVVGCCTFEVPAGAVRAGPTQMAEPPCLWSLLGKVLSRRRQRSGRKLHVNDSKQVYSTSQGLKELERSVLALAGAVGSGSAENSGPRTARLLHELSALSHSQEEPGGPPPGNGDDPGSGQISPNSGQNPGIYWDDLHAFLDVAAPQTVPQLAEYSWYAPAPNERFPLEQDAVGLRLLSNGVGAEMRRTGCRCLGLEARVVLERPLNRLFAQTRNKGNALFSIAAVHLDRLLRQYGRQDLVIFCDRQGGRENYAHVLRQMFEDWSLEILLQSPLRSDYRLIKDGSAVHLTFRQQCEEQCLCVAAASMLSKYLREALMRRFNAWWLSLLPELRPTAGYYSDGMRFLKDIDAKRRELGIEPAQLVRSR